MILKTKSTSDHYNHMNQLLGRTEIYICFTQNFPFSEDTK